MDSWGQTDLLVNSVDSWGQTDLLVNSANQLKNQSDPAACVFVTDRLLYQVEQDYQHGVGDGWCNWSSEAKWFVGHFRQLQPLRPQPLTDRLAEELVSSIAALYRNAYPACSSLSPGLVLK